MIPILICAGALQTLNAADFFPTAPGTVRTYQQKKSGEILINTVGKPLDAGGATVIPISEGAGTADTKTTYYRVEPTQVTIYAYDVNKPLVVPMPVLKVGTGNVSWDYEGKTATGAAGERLLAHGEERADGQRTILGKKVDVIVVKLKAAVGVGLSGITFEQTTVYARGIGLVEQTTESKLGKKRDSLSYSLIAFEPGK